MATPAPPAPPKMPPPPRNGSVAAPTTKAVAPTLGRLTGTALPPRIVLNGVEGFGKTTFAAHAPAPAILMARGETGYKTLLDAGRAPDVDATTIQDWDGLLALLDSLAAGESIPYQTLALDAGGGFERLMHERVCARDFGGDWGERGFASFQKGYDLAVTDWLGMLQRLDKIHARGVCIVILSHCKVRGFKNPMGSDYERYASDLHEKTWAATHKWADAVLFGTFLTIVDKVNAKSDKGKGIGGAIRMVYTERRDAYDAKNRYGMPPEIELPADPAAMWSTISPHFSKKA